MMQGGDSRPRWRAKNQTPYKPRRWTIDEFGETIFAETSIERHIMGEGTVRWFDELLWRKTVAEKAEVGRVAC